MMEPSVVKSPKRLSRKKTDTYSSYMLYDDVVKEKLKGIVLATCNPAIDDSTNFIPSEVPDGHHQYHVYHHHHKHTVSEKMSCNCCSVDFSCRQDQREHYKSDWHRYNLKLKLKGLACVLEEEFEKIAGDVSSISGSEEDSDSDTETDGSASGRQKTKPVPIPSHVRSSSIHSGTDSDTDISVWEGNIRKYPKVFFKNNLGEILSVYRCLLYHKKNPPSSQAVMLTNAMSLPQQAKWAVFMTAGGHFAGALFDGGTIVAHKTFHRYVVRAKRGSAQGNRDSQGNAPKSAGATLRRYNEAALAQEVQDLLASWSEHIKKCDLIFLRAPSFNRQMFYGGKNPAFKKDNTRIRKIPFATRRPTLNEVKRVYQMLASVEFYGNATDFKDFIPVSPIRRFSYETGKLEVVSEDKLKNLPWRSREKDNTSPLTASPKRSHPDYNNPRQTEDVVKTTHDYVLLDDGNPSSSAASGSEIELVEVEESISTLHLQEFECTKKTQRKKTKRQRHPSKHQLEPDGDVFAEEKYHLRNSLYTACKVGDAESLKNLLAVFKVMSGNKEESGDVSTLFENQSLDGTNSKTVEETNTIGEESPDITITDDSKSTKNIGKESPDITITDDSKSTKNIGKESPDITITDDSKSTKNIGKESPDITITDDSKSTKNIGKESPDIASGEDVEITITLEDNRKINNTVDNIDCDVEKMKIEARVKLPFTDGKQCEIIVSDSDSAIGNSVGYTDVESTVSRTESQVSEISINKSDNVNTLTEVKQVSDECSIPIPSRTESLMSETGINKSDNVKSLTEVKQVSDECSIPIPSRTESLMSETGINKSDNVKSLTEVKQVSDECNIPVTNITTATQESDPSVDASPSDTKSHCPTKKPSMLSTSPRQKCGGKFLSELSPLMAADILNEPFGDNETTLLHVSSRSGHSGLIILLLEAGADPSVREKSGKVPYLVGSNKETRNEFRRFMSRNPDKYDYVSAQVPSPLTAEMEAEKKQKDLEKKKIQKKLKNEKMKEKKIEMAKQRQEQTEQKRFLALSDREKRALAADKRLVQQLETQGEVVPVLSRCWQCASDMTGKIPFQYFDYKFCSTKCLQSHRKKEKS